MENERYDKILPRNLEEEMRQSYIAYSMSVIVSRALPDVRDGLKPVHRRILYSMNELNLDPGKAYKKSARIVGDTMGKYHPHGDSSIYDAMVRMAQDFSMRYMLVDGHGNFGSVDGDGAAAQRYTEARLSRIAMEMLADIDKDTIDFEPNYDGELKEPLVLPSRFPNLLVNGSSGIAVGMATNIPPHNLSEVIDGMVVLLDGRINDTEVDIEEIIRHIKGPDFPTGATILGFNGIKAAYRTGRGKVLVRAVAEIQPLPGTTNRDMIVVTELPYQVNKARLIEKIGELVREKRIDGISDLRDESDMNGIRIVIELRRDANANVILNQLYKFSQMQETFGIIMLALVDNQPRVLNIKSMLSYYIDHQKEVITRRTRFDLNKALKRAHIVEGYVKALDHIDEVLNTIRSSRDTPTAKTRLMERFGFSEEQVTAIVEMRFRSLTGLEREKLEAELGELRETIKDLQAILDDEKRLYAVIKEEVLVIKTKYGDERRTQLLPYAGDIDLEDLIDEETNVITMTTMDYIKRLPLSTYRSQNRGGKGVIGMQTREEDIVNSLHIASTHDYILFFTNLGRVHRIKAYEIPEAGRTSKGTNIVNLLNLSPGEKVAAIIPHRDKEETDGYFVMVTKNGVIKKTAIAAFKNIHKNGLIALYFKEDDELISVFKTDGNRELFVATGKGMGIRFPESNVRSMSRMAAGVRSIKLSGDDRVIGALALDEEHKILFVSERGYGKCSTIDEFNTQHRGGVGVKVYKVTPKTGNIIGISTVTDNEELMLINSDGVIIRIRISEISTLGRITSGVKLINMDENANVVGMAKISEHQLTCDEDEEEETEGQHMALEEETTQE